MLHCAVTKNMAISGASMEKKSPQSQPKQLGCGFNDSGDNDANNTLKGQSTHSLNSEQWRHFCPT